jgi:hypothetical protein
MISQAAVPLLSQNNTANENGGPVGSLEIILRIKKPSGR